MFSSSPVKRYFTINDPDFQELFLILQMSPMVFPTARKQHEQHRNKARCFSRLVENDLQFRYRVGWEDIKWRIRLHFKSVSVFLS